MRLRIKKQEKTPGRRDQTDQMLDERDKRIERLLRVMEHNQGVFESPLAERVQKALGVYWDEYLEEVN